MPRCLKRRPNQLAKKKKKNRNEKRKTGASVQPSSLQTFDAHGRRSHFVVLEAIIFIGVPAIL